MPTITPTSGAGMTLSDFGANAAHAKIDPIVNAPMVPAEK